MPRRLNDPFVNFNFLVETQGEVTAGFSEVTGMNGEIQAVEYREGRDIQGNTRKLPGLAKYGNVTLKRGVVFDQDLFRWFKTGVDGDAKRVDVDILLLDEQRQEQARWRLSQAWVVKYVAPDLKAAANEIAVNSLELAHEGLRIV